MRKRIILTKTDRPKNQKTKEYLKWVCTSLGFSSGRDIDDTSFKIMCQLLTEFKNEEIIPTVRIAESLKIESPTVNHHLRNLMESGVILREKRKVVLRGGSLSAAIEEMREDAERIFNRAIEISKEIDKRFGL